MKDKKNIPLKEKDLVDLTLGKRSAVSPLEKELAKNIRDIKKKGRIVEIPKDFI